MQIANEYRRAVLLKRRGPAEIALEKLLTENSIAFTPQAQSYCFFIDFHIHPFKLGIEVDGKGHRSPKQQAKDAKRAHLLLTWGWSLLSFLDEEVMDSPSLVLSQISWAQRTLVEGTSRPMRMNEYRTQPMRRYLTPVKA